MNLICQVIHKLEDFVGGRGNILSSGNIYLNGTVLAGLVSVNFLVKQAVQLLDGVFFQGVAAIGKADTEIIIKRF